MVTIQQLLRKKIVRRSKFHRVRARALRGNPQKRGVVRKLGTESPRKPNSAKRRVARVRLSTGKTVRAKVPGEGPGTLQKFSAVLVRGASPVDLPGVRYAIIRGKLGSNPWLERRRARSKYGVKRIHVERSIQ
jgi:small subunit ribosomal protein S12